MDVDRVAFQPRLLQILESLSQAHFVSIDLELSGVSSKPAAARNTQTLQARYAELKQAAERYQVLQIGLTFAHYDEDRQIYVLRPYNFPLNPLFDEDLDLERIFSFQSGAVDFLLSHGFNLEEPFKNGVPYLSRDEEKLAKQKAKDREDKSRFADIELQENDIQAIDFMNKIRQETNQWLKTGKPHNDWFSITSRTTDSLECSLPELTSFDKRLVHQLIRKEYPELVTHGRRDAVTIRHLDVNRERAVLKERRKKVKAQIARQTGFRWIVEAMTGGSLHMIDLRWFAQDPVTGAAVCFDVDDFSSRLNRASNLLRDHRPVLVGHNLFTDLVYLYQCFIGELPETIEEFRILIHDLFPVIVDTKYMATHNCGNINPASSLEQIEQALRNEQVPRIETHPGHNKYESTQAFHEAGYDSYLTARIMILLSAKLEAAGTYISSPTTLSEEGDYLTAPEEVAESPDSLDGGVLLSIDGKAPAQTIVAPPMSATSKSGSMRRKKRKADQVTPRTRFSSKTPFDALAGLTLDDDLDAQTNGVNLPSPFQPTTSSSSPTKPTALVSTPRFAFNPNASPFPSEVTVGGITRAKQSETKEADPAMPPFESDFWRVYSNRLRVFGTEERLFDLDPRRRK